MEPTTRRALVLLAAPAAASVILNNAFRVIDQYSVQWIGTAAQAAIGSCTFVLVLAFAGYSLVAAGTGPMVARAAGALDAAGLRKVVGARFAAAGAVGVAVHVGLFFGAEAVTQAIGLSGEAQAQAQTYLRWLAVAGLPMALAPVMDAAFIALGRTGRVMLLQVLATGLNAILNWFFIYELGLGIGGAALASGVSRLLALVLGAYWLWAEVRPTVPDFWPARQIVGRLMALGVPIAANTALYALVYWGLLRYAISPLGPAVNAALGIGFSALEGFTWPLFYGTSLAVASLVGRHLGAGQPDEARRVVRLAFPLSTGLGLGAAAAFWFGAVPLCGLFTEDPAVLAEAVVYARVLAFSQLFVAYEALSEGVLQGAGDTRAVFWWSAPLNILRVPLGWGLAVGLGLGPAGVWWAINLTTLVKALGKGVRTARGHWTSTQV